VHSIIRRRIESRKRRIMQRLDKNRFPKETSQPMMRGSTPHFELAGRAVATGYGGLGLI